MSKVNFNSLKDIKASEELIARTLAAAEEHRAAPAAAAPMWRRRFAVAASIVLVATVGISVYFFARNINSMPIAVAPAPTASVSPTEPPTAPQGFLPLPTPPAVTEAPSATPAQRPTEEPTVADSTQPVTVEPQPQTPTVPSSRPTEMLSPPTEPDTEPPTQTDNTYPPELKDPTDPPSDPSEGSGGQPGEIPSEPVVPPRRQAIILGHFSTGLLTGSGKVYCTLYSSSGAYMGYDDPFSPLHKTETILINDDGIIWVRYRVPEAMTPFTDVYTAVFYNEDGETVCTNTKRITVD